MSVRQVHVPSAIKTAVGAGLLLAAVLMLAETPPAASGGLNLTATTANVSGAPDPVRFEILRWSTDEERDRLMAAWELSPATSGKGGGGKGPANSKKGSAKGGPAAPQITPEAALATALQQTTTVGYLWSSEIAGYALRYAGKANNPDGSQRIILITQRRLGAVNQLWNPAAEGAANTLDFSVIELRLNAKTEGEGKASLTGKLATDSTAKMVTLENYTLAPVTFQNVRIPMGKTTAGKQ